MSIMARLGALCKVHRRNPTVSSSSSSSFSSSSSILYTGSLEHEDENENEDDDAAAILIMPARGRGGSLCRSLCLPLSEWFARRGAQVSDKVKDKVLSEVESRPPQDRLLACL